ncbi:MAG: radical SAM/SPASM domain-containing protein [Promethearchaeota archaeon]
MVELIDEAQLATAYEKDGIYALQLEVGDRCEQGCVYCYMNAIPDGSNTLSDRDIAGILEGARDLGVTAVEWLGGEPLLRPSIFEHMELARELGLRNNVWTGGLPLYDEKVAERCADLAANGLLSVHVSSVDPSVYALLHPTRAAGDLEKILAGVENLLEVGYPATQVLNSVTFTGLQDSTDMVATMDYFESRYGIVTSLNVYHSYLRPGTPVGELERFVPSPREVALVYKRYARQQGARVVPMNCVNKQYCSATCAVLCDGSVTPCATIRELGAPNIHTDGEFAEIVRRNLDHLVFKHLKDVVNLPADCQSCVLRANCWGCRSRSYAAGLGLFGKDPACTRHPGKKKGGG